MLRKLFLYFCIHFSSDGNSIASGNIIPLAALCSHMSSEGISLKPILSLKGLVQITLVDELDKVFSFGISITAFKLMSLQQKFNNSYIFAVQCAQAASHFDKTDGLSLGNRKYIALHHLYHIGFPLRIGICAMWQDALFLPYNLRCFHIFPL